MGPVKANLFGMTWSRTTCLIPLIGYAFGAYLEWKETLRMTGFRDKSALYGKPPGERQTPSWPLVLE